MRRFLEVIDSVRGERYQIELAEDQSGPDESAPHGPRPRRPRLPRAPSWVHAPRPSDPPPMRAS